MTPLLWGAIAVAGTVALAAPLALRPLLQRLGTFDVPNHRSSHTRPTLRGGGIAPLLGIAFGGLWAISVLDGDAALIVAVVTGAAVAMGLLGLLEDVRGLGVGTRAGTQLIVGAAVALVLGSLTNFHSLWVPVIAVFFAANVNFTNFMDGVNGISGFHGLVAGLLYAGQGVITGLPGLTVIGLLVAVCFACFLPWNFAPPGMFLGDVGSYLLGGVLGATAIASLAAGISPVAALAPLAIYWADAVTTLCRRATRGEPIFQAHRTHAYQRLTNTGVGHLGVALIVAGFTSMAGVIGLLAVEHRLHEVIGLLGVTLVLVGYLLLPRLRGDRFPPPVMDDLADVSLPDPTSERPDWIPRRWAVFGASGFVGSATVAHLRANGFIVLEFSAPRLSLEPSSRDGEQLGQLALNHPAKQDIARRLEGVEVVVNAAGMASPDGSASAALYGANALLPAVVAAAARDAGVGRFIHLSSAAVQGDSPILDATPAAKPFSPYSRSKALGERALLALVGKGEECPQAVVLRATSVQGEGRPTTEALRRLARSPLASVAAPGSQPSVVSSIDGLVEFVRQVGLEKGALPRILLQPWEGLSVKEVLEAAGGHPVVLRAALCRAVIRLGKAAARCFPGLAGHVRRVEVMWFGQAQVAAPQSEVNSSRIRRQLEGRR